MNTDRLPSRPIVMMFSGQGSQCFHMGQHLFEYDRIFNERMCELDAWVRDRYGLPVLAEVYNDRRSVTDPFRDILLTHPAIFITEVAVAEALIRRMSIPNHVVGVSLGAFAAACISQALKVEDGLAAVCEHAFAVRNSCEAGSMTGVLSSPVLVDAILERHKVEVAAMNSSWHFVASGTQEGLDGMEQCLKARGIAFQRLPVEYAFHSISMDAAKPKFLRFAEALDFERPVVPLVCCSSTTCLSRVTASDLWDSTRKMIRFSETLAKLEQGGPFSYVDCGPAASLATVVKHALPRSSGSAAFSVLHAHGRRGNQRDLFHPLPV